MATNSRAELLLAKRWRDRETSPERTKVWVEHRSSSERKAVPVVYYLCRNGHLEHPHFMEVPLSSLQGLFLKDVFNRLDFLRGKGMANLYSWAAKRSYRNGFVWQDLSENDIIHPAYGHEYVLKGSELLDTPSSYRIQKLTPPPPPEENSEGNDSGGGCESPMIVRRRNQSWSSFDPQEYKVYKPETAGEPAGKSTDAATQTDDRRPRRREAVDGGEEVRRAPDDPHRSSTSAAELSREEDISPPPPSSSSTDASETAAGEGSVSRRRGAGGESADIRDQTAGNERPSGRMKASAVLMQLISCVSSSVKPGESASGKDPKGLGSGEYAARLHREAWNPGKMGLK